MSNHNGFADFGQVHSRTQIGLDYPNKRAPQKNLQVTAKDPKGSKKY